MTLSVVVVVVFFLLVVVARVSMKRLCCKISSSTVREEPGLESGAVVFGRSWVVPELNRLRCGSAAVWDPSEHFVVDHT